MPSWIVDKRIKNLQIPAPKMHIATAIEDAQEMSDLIKELPSDQLAWLILKSRFRELPEWEPRAVLIAEVIRRLAPEVLTMEITPRGWITESGELIEYEKAV